MEEHECGKDCEHNKGKKKEFHGVKVYPGMKIKWQGKKVLPNDRCPCGSGKKYKKCCGR